MLGPQPQRFQFTLSGRVPGICSFKSSSDDFNVQPELRIIRLNDTRLQIRFLKKKKKILTFFPLSTSSANSGKFELPFK